MSRGKVARLRGRPTRSMEGSMDAVLSDRGLEHPGLLHNRPACPELTFCLPSLPRRPRFWPQAAVAIPAYVALFNSHLLVVPVSGTWLVSLRATFDLCRLDRSALPLRRRCRRHSSTVLPATRSRASFVIRNARTYFPAPPARSWCPARSPAGAAVPWCLRRAALVPRPAMGGTASQPDVNNGFLLVRADYAPRGQRALNVGVQDFRVAESGPYAVCSVMCYVLAHGAVRRLPDLPRWSASVTWSAASARASSQRGSGERRGGQRQFHDLKHQIGDGGRRAPREVPGGARALHRAYDASVHSGDGRRRHPHREEHPLLEPRHRLLVHGRWPVPGRPGRGRPLYPLGNALDNAIEAAEKVPSWEARVVSVRAWSRGGLAFLCVENSCVTGGACRRRPRKTPTTTGFGLRSIRDIARRHGGNLTPRARRRRFSLTVLLPMG